MRATTAVADVSDEAAVEAAVAAVTDALGTVSLVANVAGGSGPGFGLGPLLGVPSDEFRRVLDVNVVGTWLVSKACATRMVASGVGGRICNVSSQAGKRGFPFLGPYCAAKAGVILLTQTMALELGPAGIAVNAVCPGTVDTDLINKDAMFENLMGGPDGLGVVHRPRDPAGPPAERRGDRRRHLLAALGRGPGRHRRGVERQRRTDNGVAMPILDARHDLAHPVEGDSAWSESYYFNAYDPGTDSGLFSRIGIRPNEGTMDVGLSLWLPGGELGEYRWVKEQREMVDTVLEVGAVRYEMLEAVQSWRLTAEGEVQARTCVRGETAAHPVRVALDVRFDALTPAIGTDGQPQRRPAVGRGRGGGGHGGQGASRAGRALDGLAHRRRRRVTSGSGALGNRDRSWGPRRWGGPKMWRWFSINFADGLHFGGIRLGTEAGDLHRGWVWDDGRAASVAEWRVRTELADDGVTHRVVHLDVVDKEGRTYPLRGDVLRVADIGRAGGTMVNEGLARWSYGEDPHRLRHLRVPAPARRRREARRPGRA